MWVSMESSANSDGRIDASGATLFFAPNSPRDFCNLEGAAGIGSSKNHHQIRERSLL